MLECIEGKKEDVAKESFSYNPRGERKVYKNMGWSTEILIKTKQANSIKRTSIFPLNEDSWYPVTSYVNNKLKLMQARRHSSFQG